MRCISPHQMAQRFAGWHPKAGGTKSLQGKACKGGSGPQPWHASGCCSAASEPHPASCMGAGMLQLSCCITSLCRLYGCSSAAVEPHPASCIGAGMFAFDQSKDQVLESSQSLWLGASCFRDLCRPVCM
eukprot:1160730-Pelagomonas_calceolata.AAC.11